MPELAADRGSSGFGGPEPGKPRFRLEGIAFFAFVAKLGFSSPRGGLIIPSWHVLRHAATKANAYLAQPMVVLRRSAKSARRIPIGRANDRRALAVCQLLLVGSTPIICAFRLVDFGQFVLYAKNAVLQCMV